MSGFEGYVDLILHGNAKIVSSCKYSGPWTQLQLEADMANADHISASTDRAKARTYDELLADSALTDGEKSKLRAEATLGNAAAVMVRRGDQKTAHLLLDVLNAVIEWDPEDRTEDLWLEVSPEHMNQFTKEVTDHIKEVCVDVSQRRRYGVDWVGVREILPAVGPGWRDQLRDQISGKRPTNHAQRIQTEPRRYAEDGLLFTNEGERTVYRALRKIQEKDFPLDETIGIYPLPRGRVPDHTWEPDILVTYKGRAGILEVDGPSHNGRRALDRTRDHILLDAGVAFVDRVPVEALADHEELTAILKRFLRRLGDAR